MGGRCCVVGDWISVGVVTGGKKLANVWGGGGRGGRGWRVEVG